VLAGEVAGLLLDLVEHAHGSLLGSLVSSLVRDVHQLPYVDLVTPHTAIFQG